MISVTKLFEFEAAHYLPKHKGKCKNLHGHTYKLEVEVTAGRGNFLGEDGMVMDFSDLKSIVENYINENLDHAYLNQTITGTPTAENMLIILSTYLEGKFRAPLKVVRIRLWETSTSYAEWRKEND